MRRISSAREPSSARACQQCKGAIIGQVEHASHHRLGRARQQCKVVAGHQTIALDEGLELDEAHIKEDPRHSSSLNALMEESRLDLIVETSLFVTCFDMKRIL